MSGDGRGEVALLRLAAQRLVGPPVAGTLEAVRHLMMVQAQDLPGSLLSVALRSGGTRAGVEQALTAGQVVRTWPARGTLHLVAADDLHWLLDLLAVRELRASAGRRTSLGLSDEDVARAGGVAVDAMAGGRWLRRAELFALWEGAGLRPADQRGVHLLRALAMTGSLVFGPVVDGEPLLVLVDDWVVRPAVRERERALQELALRFFGGHGPASTADLVRWSGLTLTDARRAAALARPDLELLHVDGVEQLMDPATPERLAQSRDAALGVLLLPGFDELVLGYGDRSAQLDPAFRDRLTPGGNGVFRPTVVHAGRIVGTWSTGPDGTVTATPFTTFSPEVVAALPAAEAVLHAHR